MQKLGIAAVAIMMLGIASAQAEDAAQPMDAIRAYGNMLQASLAREAQVNVALATAQRQIEDLTKQLAELRKAGAK